MRMLWQHALLDGMQGMLRHACAHDGKQARVSTSPPRSFGTRGQWLSYLLHPDMYAHPCMHTHACTPMHAHPCMCAPRSASQPWAGHHTMPCKHSLQPRMAAARTHAPTLPHELTDDDSNLSPVFHDHLVQGPNVAVTLRLDLIPICHGEERLVSMQEEGCSLHRGSVRSENGRWSQTLSRCRLDLPR